jgi:hypothetical protein
MFSFSTPILVAAGLGTLAICLAQTLPSEDDLCAKALNSTPTTRREFPGFAEYNKYWLQKLSSSNVREHGWELYQGVVSPAGIGCPASRVPLWLSWVTKRELFFPAEELEGQGREIQLLPSTTLGMDQIIQQILRTGVPASKVGNSSSKTADAAVDFNGALLELILLFPNGPFRMPVTNERIIFSTAQYNPAAEKSGLAQSPDLMKQTHATVPSAIGEPTPSNAIIVKPIWVPFKPGDASACLPVWNPNKIPTDLRAYGPDKWPDQVKLSMAPQVASTKTDYCVPSGGGAPVPVPLVSIKEFFSMEIKTQDNQDALGTVLPPSSPHLGQVQVSNWVVLVGFHVISKEVKSWSWNTYWWEPEKYRYGPMSEGRPIELDPPWSNYVMNSSLDEATNPSAESHGRCDVMAIYNPYQEAALPDQTTAPLPKICGQPRVLGGLASNCRSCHSLASYLSQPTIAIQPSMTWLKDYFKDKTRTGFLWSIPNFALQ